MCSGDSWTWNGTDWTQLHPQTSPPPFLPAMTYNSPEAAVLLHNMNLNIPATGSGDGATWTLKASASNNPTPRPGSPRMPFDPATHPIFRPYDCIPTGASV